MAGDGNVDDSEVVVRNDVDGHYVEVGIDENENENVHNGQENGGRDEIVEEPELFRSRSSRNPQHSPRTPRTPRNQGFFINEVEDVEIDLEEDATPKKSRFTRTRSTNKRSGQDQGYVNC
jgi:hypothetical protein